jgi:DNA (cytosine-5)-methyltransferase 1
MGLRRVRLLDLFSGIGGFSLGLERAGFKTVAFCEIDPFCRAVLRKHWPDVPCYDDVTTLDGGRLRADGIEIDAICGGFPCQDISVAGKGAGITGARSGLWTEYARIIGELRPRYVIVENVSALLGRGMDAVLGDLAALGYGAEWHCIPASAIGAPHRRDRVWIVAYPNAERCGRWANDQGQASTERDRPAPTGDVADADLPRLEGRLAASLRECAEQRFAWAGGFQGWNETKWFAEPDVGRVAHGVPLRVERLRSLGNAIVPQIAEIIGRAIMHSTALT